MHLSKIVPGFIPASLKRDFTSKGVSILSSQTEFFLCLVLVGLLFAVTVCALVAIIYAMTEPMYSDNDLGETIYAKTVPPN